jgi:hypothetical protein
MSGLLQPTAADPLGVGESDVVGVVSVTAWPSLLRFGALVATAVLALLSCFVVLRHRRRLARLCGVRALLSILLLLWPVGALVSRRSMWDTTLPTLGIPPLAADRFEHFCMGHAITMYGVLEPATLALIGLLFHSKSRGTAATPWRPWRLVRCALAATLLVALLQTGVVVSAATGVAPSLLGPQPLVSPPPPPPPLSQPLPPPPPPWAPGGEGASPRLVHDWWRAEGCATTYGSVIVGCVFTLVFTAAWTFACQRLKKTVVNLKMRQRLCAVQATFTLVPPLLLLLRAALLFLPPSWTTSRRLCRDAELFLSLLASLIAMRALIVRPVLEASAPVLSPDEEEQQQEQRPGSPSQPSHTSSTRRRPTTGGSRSSSASGASEVSGLSVSTEGGGALSAWKPGGDAEGSAVTPTAEQRTADDAPGSDSHPPRSSPHRRWIFTSPSAASSHHPGAAGRSRRLFFLGRQPKGAAQAPTLMVAVDLSSPDFGGSAAAADAG